MFAIKIGWGDLHWIDLTLTKLMEVSIFKIHLTKIHCLQNVTLLRPKKNVQKHKKRSNGPKTDFLAQ